MVHRREILEAFGGWDEKCRWLEDWDFLLRVSLAFPDKVKWIPRILVDYRQVFGVGADGVCAEARENIESEIKSRQYLLNKWKHHPDFDAFKSLKKKAQDLLLMRAKV